MLHVAETSLPGVLVVETRIHRDDRGYFVEIYRRRELEAAGLPPFVQMNRSRSRTGVLRGIHYRIERPQGLLVCVSRGAIFDVAVDLRPASPSFRHWYGTRLDDEDHRQLYIPPGCAHGFCVLTEEADVHYQVTHYYDPEDEAGIRWDDSDLGIEWPTKAPLLSNRDRTLPYLKDLPPKALPWQMESNETEGIE